MPESDPFGPPFLDQSAKPLPWTKGGPNEDSKPLEPTTSHVNSSVADPIFTIKNRVVTMKDLEALKKSLPPGIDIRITSKNIVKFRARFRVVYLDGEMSIYTMKDRIEKIYNSHEFKPPLNYFKLVNSFL
jgi:hypothetical protein